MMWEFRHGRMSCTAGRVENNRPSIRRAAAAMGWDAVIFTKPSSSVTPGNSVAPVSSPTNLPLAGTGTVRVPTTPPSASSSSRVASPAVFDGLTRATPVSRLAAAATDTGRTLHTSGMAGSTPAEATGAASTVAA